MIDLFAEMSDENPGEKNARCSKANAPKFETPKRHTEDANKGKHADRMCDGLRFMKLEKPAHAQA
jgi:hypothetical protein